jgi:hypothetical protein
MVLGLGKPKEDPAKKYAQEAFGALKEGDEDGFVEAFLSAVRACKGKGYESETDDADEE